MASDETKVPRYELSQSAYVYPIRSETDLPPEGHVVVLERDAMKLEAEVARLRRERDDLAAYLRAVWNSSHAQRDSATSYSARQFYEGRIAGIEQVAGRASVSLCGEEASDVD